LFAGLFKETVEAGAFTLSLDPAFVLIPKNMHKIDIGK